MINVAIAGCTGRMGRTLLATGFAFPGIRLVGGLVSAKSPFLGKDLGLMLQGEPVGIQATEDITALFHHADAVIDFTTPHLTTELAALAAKHKKILITGTTGLSEIQQSMLQKAAQDTVIVQSFNMSLGVNILAALVEQTAAILGDDFDIEILEMHHRHKVDSPSGTALMLGEAAAKGRQVNLAEKACYSRTGHMGARPAGEIGFAVLRGGGVIGDHTVLFADESERIELTHKSSSRDIYAKGAFKAALWAKQQPCGLYSMRDVIQDSFKK